MKLKSFILTIALSLFALSGLLAQDKYEYAIVYSAMGGGSKSGIIYVTKGKEYEEIPFKVDKGTATSNFLPLLDYVEKMENEGWQMYSTGNNGYIVIYYLRKKKNQ
ncbi:MAG TPA: hypothetical protein VK154_09985 [Chitinophagales bacterium]|nr:hypothetical protein [Chitinophagales bacterium]